MREKGGSRGKAERGMASQVKEQARQVTAEAEGRRRHRQMSKALTTEAAGRVREVCCWVGGWASKQDEQWWRPRGRMPCTQVKELGRGRGEGQTAGGMGRGDGQRKERQRGRKKLQEKVGTSRRVDGISPHHDFLAGLCLCFLCNVKMKH